MLFAFACSRRTLLQRVFSEWKAVFQAAQAGLSALLMAGLGKSSLIIRLPVASQAVHAGSLGLHPAVSAGREPAVVQLEHGRIARAQATQQKTRAQTSTAVAVTTSGALNESLDAVGERSLVGVVFAGLHASRYQALAPSVLAAYLDAIDEQHARSDSALSAHPIAADWARGFQDLNEAASSAVEHDASASPPTLLQWSPSASSGAFTAHNDAHDESFTHDKPVAFPVRVSSLGEGWADYPDEFVWVTTGADGQVTLVPPPPAPEQAPASQRGHIAASFLHRRPDRAYSVSSRATSPASMMTSRSSQRSRQDLRVRVIPTNTPPHSNRSVDRYRQRIQAHFNTAAKLQQAVPVQRPADVSLDASDAAPAGSCAVRERLGWQM